MRDGEDCMLGIPASETAINWHQVIFSMLTLKGIRGREMYETWVQDDNDAGLWPRHPVITHRVSIVCTKRVSMQ